MISFLYTALVDVLFALRLLAYYCLVTALRHAGTVGKRAEIYENIHRNKG